MKSPLAVSTRFSGFRFSLHGLRSPISPITPDAPRFHHNDHGISTSHSTSHSSSPTARGTPDPNEKELNAAVTAVDHDDVNALRSPVVLPSPRASPITPWHATFHRHAATTEQETAYLRRTGHLRHARSFLSALLFATAATLTGLQSDIFHHYRTTHLASDWHLSLWPTDLNLTPTLLALITGSLATLLSIVVLVSAGLPSPNPRTKLNIALFTLLSAICTILPLVTLLLSTIVTPAAIFSTFISSTLTSLLTTTGPASTVGLSPNGVGSSPKRETIQSFTCTIANSAHAFDNDATTLNLPNLTGVSSLVPSGFSRICAESKAGLAIVILLMGLGVFSLVVAVWSWAIERKIERLRGEREVIASRTGSRDFRVDGKDMPESFVGLPYEKTC